MLDLACTLQRLRAALGQTEVLDLALLLKLLHLLDRLLDRSDLVEAVAIVEIDVRNTEAPQRLLASLAQVLGARVDVAGAIFSHGIGKFGGEEDVLTLARVLLEPLSKQILAVLVHVCGVPEEVALLVDLVEDLEALLIGLRGAVEGALDQ